MILSLLCISLLSGLEAGAATKQTSISLPPFTGINVTDGFEVSIVRGSDYRVLLSVEEAFADYVVCNVNGKVMNLELNERSVPAEVRRQFRSKGTPDPVFSAVIYVPELLQSVTLADRAVLKDTEDVFDKARVTFDLSSSASVQRLSVSSQSVRISMRNKSVADFIVACNVLEAETQNSASLNVEETSQDSDYSLLGSSKITAKSRTANLKVRTKAGSVLRISGSGDKASYELSGTSEVYASDFEVPDAVVNMSSVCMIMQSAYRTLKVSLNGGSTLFFANDPQIIVDNIKSSTMTRMSGGSSAKL